MMSFLGDVLLIASAGVILDNIFIKDEERARISEYLESSSSSGTNHDKLVEFLKLALDVVFSRFFGSKSGSLKFFFSAMTVSLLSFFGVSALQIFTEPKALDVIVFSLPQCAIILAFILFNISFDYFTIVQTKIFIEASLSAKDTFRTALFIVSDLFVTINTFIILFSFFVVLFLQFFLIPVQKVTFATSRSTELREIESERDINAFRDLVKSDILERVKYEGEVSGVLVPSNGEQTESIYIPIVSTTSPKSDDYIPMLLAVSSAFNVVPTSAVQRVEKSEVPDLERAIQETIPDLQLLLQQIRDDEPGTTIGRFDFAIDGSVFRNGFFQRAYTNVFSEVDKMEDSFPASIIGHLWVENVGSFIRRTLGNNTQQNPQAVCFFSEGRVSSFPLLQRTSEYLTSCNEFMLIEARWVDSLQGDLSTIGRDVHNYYIPYNTLLITSVVPTALFYLVVLMLAGVAGTYRWVLIRTARIKRYFLRAPFTIVATALGIVLVTIMRV